MWWPNGDPRDGDCPLIAEGGATRWLRSRSIRRSRSVRCPASVTAPSGWPSTCKEPKWRSGLRRGQGRVQRNRCRGRCRGRACHDLGVPDGRDLAECLAAVPRDERRVPHGRLSDARSVEEASEPQRGAEPSRGWRRRRSCSGSVMSGSRGCGEPTLARIGADGGARVRSAAALERQADMLGHASSRPVLARGSAPTSRSRPRRRRRSTARWSARARHWRQPTTSTRRASGRSSSSGSPNRS